MFLVLVVGAASAAPATGLTPGRSYELVTPPDTGSVPPGGGTIGRNEGLSCFETSLNTEDGERVVYGSEMGALEGYTSNGVLNLYEAHRSNAGWLTESKTATATQTTHASGGLCLSPDHQYSTLLTGKPPFDQGSLVLEGKPTSYVRNPDGSYVLVGNGTIGTDPSANVKWISSGASHVIFTAQKRLLPEAPVGVGTSEGYSESERPINAVYDRTPLGLKVVSLLPSGSAPNSATETTFYRGVSADGGTVVFNIVQGTTSTMYAKRAGSPSVAIAPAAPTRKIRFGGISTDGRKLVYVERDSEAGDVRGSIFVADTESGASVPVTTGTASALVNVSDDASGVYFTSLEALPGSGQNDLGQSAQAGSPNLYYWDSATETVDYVATVSALDAEQTDGGDHESLTEWVQTAMAAQQTGLVGRMNASSRTTPDGSVFVFQARGDVAGYDSGSEIEIYRYDTTSSSLDCISCPAGDAPAASSAFLQMQDVGPMFVLNALARIPNVSLDGETIFFMTGEALEASDVNGTVDVYEWKAGEVSLISSGQGTIPSLLYGMSADARDVFFVTTDQLVPQDTSSVQSIYDARLGGGFPVPDPKPICEGDACQGQPAIPPLVAPATTESFSGPGDPPPTRKPCRKRGKKPKQVAKKKHCQKRASHNRAGKAGQK
jgi:hypothetical protein